MLWLCWRPGVERCWKRAQSSTSGFSKFLEVPNGLAQNRESVFDMSDMEETNCWWHGRADPEDMTMSSFLIPASRFSPLSPRKKCSKAQLHLTSFPGQISRIITRKFYLETTWKIYRFPFENPWNSHIFHHPKDPTITPRAPTWFSRSTTGSSHQCGPPAPIRWFMMPTCQNPAKKARRSEVLQRFCRKKIFKKTIWDWEISISI